MRLLILHPSCATGSIVRIDAAVEQTDAGCRATFVATGEIGKIRIPKTEIDRGRYDDLWRTTCFEIFWQAEGCAAYREFNLSPSARWACYDFDDFRDGMRNAPAEVDIDVAATANELRLTANIQSALPVPAKVALNSIIEDADSVNRFWALDFATGAPEFHSEVCRSWKIRS